MHCLICDNVLSDVEATRKLKGEFADICSKCNSNSKGDLTPSDEPVDEWEEPSRLYWGEDD